MQTFPIQPLKPLTKFALGTVISSIGIMIAQSPAQAILLGDDVTGQFGATGNSPVLNQTTTVIDPGTEFAFVNDDATLSLDVKDDSFDITYNLGSFPAVGADTSWILSDLDFNPSATVTGVTLTSGKSSLISSTSFTDDSITVNLLDVTLAAEGQINSWSFDIETASASVPFEFSPTLGLVIAGLSFGVTKYRQAKLGKKI